MAVGSIGLASLVAHASEPAQEFAVVVERYVVEAVRSNPALQGQTLEVIGFIALIGIETKNSILLVDFTDRLRAEACRSTQRSSEPVKCVACPFC
jgi:hypothetical protein